MDHLRFEQLARGLEVDRDRHDQMMRTVAPASRCYVLLFAARSGSSWLRSVLASARLFGVPEEFINPDFVRDVARQMNATTAEELLAALKRVGKSANGVFGLKTREIDVELLGFQAFCEAFATNTVFFHLWRENLVAQGISLYRATATARFHSIGMDEGRAPPPYDADVILHWVIHVLETENANVRLLTRLRRPARQLRYERIVADRAGTLLGFARVLGVSLPATALVPGDGELEKLADGWNQEMERRLRAERGDELAGMEAARLIVHGAPGNPHPPPPVDDARLLHIWQQGHRAGLAGDSPWSNRNEAGSAAAGQWLLGWLSGWDSQQYL